jgi:glutamyl-tRNA synthetase
MSLKNYIKKIFGGFGNNEKVVVRIAPSPTGNLHIGTSRTALFNYLYAKQNNGKFILRIEDTDKERSKKEYEDNIVEGLEWLGITWDDFYRQSEREEKYKEYLEKLIKNGKAYVSKEKPKEEGQRSEVIRFKNPNIKVSFDDLIRGKIEFDTTELGDFVIAKDMETPLYHLAVVVDDFEMNITHVIRGEDHISNTPRQILLQEAIGAKRPFYAHLPLSLNKERAKLSKRDGALSISEFKDMGYLPEALINFLASLGWAPKDNRELFSIEDLVQSFRLEDIQKGGAVFNTDKLDWFNKEWIKKMSNDAMFDLISDKVSINKEILKKALPDIKERIEKLVNLEKMFDIDGEFEYLVTIPPYAKEKINWKSNSNEITKTHLMKVLSLIGTISENDFSHDNIKSEIFPYADKEGRGDVLWPLRFALSGKDKSIDPFRLCYILGKEETVKRIENAIKKLD